MGLFVALALASENALALPKICSGFFSKRERAAETSEPIAQVLALGRQSPYSFETVKYSHNFDGYLYLNKVAGPWRSLSTAYSRNTPQGDPRVPMAILGPELAYAIGFRIKPLGADTYEMRVPGSQVLSAKIATINSKLQAAKLDKFGYSLVTTGYLTAEEILNLAAEISGDIILKFAFAEMNPKIAAHEVTYHYNLVWPTEVLIRAHHINLLTKKFVGYLRVHKADFVYAETLAEWLVEKRSEALDIGTGNCTGLLGALRLGAAGEGRPTYSYMLAEWQRQRANGTSGFYSDNLPALAENINRLAHSTLTPIEYLRLQVAILSGDSPVDNGYFEGLRARFKDVIHRSDFVPITSPFKLDPTQRDQLARLMSDFIKTEGREYEARSYRLITADDLVVEWLSQLDERIKVATDALQ